VRACFSIFVGAIDGCGLKINAGKQLPFNSRTRTMMHPANQGSAGRFQRSSSTKRGAAEDSGATDGNENVCDAMAIMESYRTCEFTTVFRDGAPQTWPVSPLLLKDGHFLLCTSIGFPQKAFNIRRNPKVSLLFSNPTGSGLSNPGAVLICGDAVAEDRVITDITSLPGLADLVRTVMERQPSSRFMSSFVGRRVFSSYYWRIAIYVTPVQAFFWPARDFAVPPQSLDLEELCRVASGR
jgi:hypothetical protein